MSFLIENPNFDLIDLDDPIEENIPSFGHSQDIVFNDVFHDFDIENFSYVNINPIQDFELTINHFSFEFEPKQKQKQIQNNQNQNQNQNNENQNNENQEERQIKTKTNPMKIPTQTSKTFSHSPFKLNNSLEQFDKPISFESEVTDALQFFQTVEKIDFIFRETEENPTKTETETPNEPNNKWQEESIKIKTTRSLISKKRSKRKPKDDESSQNNESSFYNMTNNDKQNIKKQRTILIKTKSKVKHSTKTEGKQVKSERAYILQCAGKFGIRRLQPFWDSLQSRKIIPQKVEMAKTKNLENEKNLENIKNLENAKNSEKKKKRTRFIKSKQATKHFHEVNWHDEEVSMLREYVVAFGRNWKKISSLLGNTKSPTQIKALYYKRRIDVFADLLGLDEIAINEDDAEIQQRQIGGSGLEEEKKEKKGKTKESSNENLDENQNENQNENSDENSDENSPVQGMLTTKTQIVSLKLPNDQIVTLTEQCFANAEMIFKETPRISLKEIQEWTDIFDKVTLLGQTKPDVKVLKTPSLLESSLSKLRIGEPHIFYAEYQSVLGNATQILPVRSKIKNIPLRESASQKQWITEHFVSLLLALNTTINRALQRPQVKNDPRFHCSRLFDKFHNIPSFTRVSEQSVASLKFFLAWLELRLESKRILEIKAEIVSDRHVRNIVDCSQTSDVLTRMTQLTNEMKVFKELLLQVVSEVFLYFIKNI